tara:strand:- start:384 stop:653 length:270 start_codon:yes stop_codon:yes gene_type:complete
MLDDPSTHRGIREALRGEDPDHDFGGESAAGIVAEWVQHMLQVAGGPDSDQCGKGIESGEVQEDEDGFLAEFSLSIGGTRFRVSVKKGL